VRFKRMTAIAAIAVVALGTASCAKKEEPAAPTSKFENGTTMDRIAKAGRLNAGTKWDQPLFGLKGLEKAPAGFDVEFVKIIAKELGIADDKIHWEETVSKVREDFIASGRVDLIVATYTINDARKEKISFAGPYYEAGQDILVAKDDTTITGPDSFKTDPTKKVCSVTGSTPAKKILEYATAPGQIVLFDVYTKCLDALKNKQVSAITTDNVILMGYVSKEPDKFKVLGKPFTKEPYGIGVKKDDKVFRDWINDIIEKAFADGRYKAAWEKTVGNIAPMPAAVKVNRY
jgi:glutamate transport system substrate-binding protein